MAEGSGDQSALISQLMTQVKTLTDQMEVLSRERSGRSASRDSRRSRRSRRARRSRSRRIEALMITVITAVVAAIGIHPERGYPLHQQVHQQQHHKKQKKIAKVEIQKFL